MPLTEKERLTNLGDLAAILAHEMKNPMNSIIINLELLRSALTQLSTVAEDPTSQRAKKYVDIVEGEVKRLDKVLRGFLDLASPPKFARTKFKVNPLIKVMVDFMSAEFRSKGADLSYRLEPDLPPIFGSTDEFKQALLNLMLNALQAGQAENSKIFVSSRRDNGWIVVEVSDNGHGIEESQLAKIFDPYFTTKAKGSGLGLTVVRRFAVDHGGDVQVSSRMGEGTTFTIRLPIAAVATE